MRIIGIDPGLTRCGIGVVRLVGPRRVEFEHVEVLRSHADQDLSERLKLLGGSIERILDGDPFDALAIERIFAQQNLPSVMGVAHISGVAMFLAANRGISVTQYTPNEVKSQVSGYGAADKAQVATMVAKHLRLQSPPKPADASDALALAITHALVAGGSVSRARVAPRSGALTPAQRAWQDAEAASRGVRRKH